MTWELLGWWSFKSATSRGWAEQPPGLASPEQGLSLLAWGGSWGPVRAPVKLLLLVRGGMGQGQGWAKAGLGSRAGPAVGGVGSSEVRVMPGSKFRWGSQWVCRA